MVRTGSKRVALCSLVALFGLVSCTRVRDVPWTMMPDNLGGKCLRTKQPMLLMATKSGAGEAVLEPPTADLQKGPGLIRQVEVGTEIIVDRVVLESSFEDVVVVVLGRVQLQKSESLSVDLYRLFDTLYADNLTRLATGTPVRRTRPIVLDPVMAEWCAPR